MQPRRWECLMSASGKLPNKMDAKREIEALEISLERFLAWIRQSDTKAQMLIAINLVEVSAVIGNTPKLDTFNWAVVPMLALGATIPFLNLWKCFAAISPHVK